MLRNGCVTWCLDMLEHLIECYLLSTVSEAEALKLAKTATIPRSSVKVSLRGSHLPMNYSTRS